MPEASMGPGGAAPAEPWAAVGLTPEEYRDITGRLGREPSVLELGLFGAMWSEHCSYKSSRAYLGRLPSDAPQVLVGPGENAGVLDLGGGHAVALRMESHNHPSAVEPFQGAATGVGGILRDIFTMGARPVALLDGLRFGPPATARNRYLAAGVTAGIAHYGNCTGVPTVGGETTFDPVYAENPLVNVMCVGYLELAHLQRGAAPGPGNRLLLIGNRTGRDGIHGASLLASQGFRESAGELRPAVQVGDPFVGKLLIEACLELAASGRVRGLNDLGAAGLTSAAAETAGRAGTGVLLDLDQVPCREEGMSPYEIMLSESQERMLLIAAPEDEAYVLGVCRRWGLQAARVGTVTADGRLRVVAGGEVQADVPAAHLSHGAPRYRRPARRPPRPRAFVADGAGQPDLRPEEAREVALQLLRQPTLASKRWLYRQYDHQVQTNTVLPPGRGDAAVLRHRPTGAGIALSLDMEGRICALDPFTGAARLVAEGARNVACAGGRPYGLTNCLNFPSPEDPGVMGAFIRTVDGLAAACRRLRIPVTGGNVSFYNETGPGGGQRIHPTPAVGMLGVLPRAADARGSGAVEVGHTLFALGSLARCRLDGSEYQAWRWGLCAGAPLPVRWAEEEALQRLLAGDRALPLASAHDVAAGGLLVALAEVVLTAARPGLGLEVALPRPRGRGQAARLDNLLFGEGPGRVLVTVADDGARLRQGCAELGLACRRLGQVTAGGDLAVTLGARPFLRLAAPQLAAWEEALPSCLE